MSKVIPEEHLIRVGSMTEPLDFLAEKDSHSLKEVMFEKRTPIEAVISHLEQIFNKLSFSLEERREALDYMANRLLKGAEIPDTPPEIYAQRSDKNEKPIDFIARVYAPWLGRGLAQADIKRLDRQLYMALHNWLRHNELPPSIDLPTKSEVVTRQLEQVGPAGVRKASRIATAAYMRQARLRQG